MNRILYICAHPDDCELMFGGMINNFVRKGAYVSLIIVSDGSKWACLDKTQLYDIKAIRKAEALNSAEMLGIKHVIFLDCVDGSLNRHELFEPLLKSIRELNPNIIFTHSEKEWHPDHIEVSYTVKRLCNQLSEVAPILNNFWMSEVAPVSNFHSLYTYAAISEINDYSTFFVALEKEDIENKINAIFCHESQFGTKPHNMFCDKIRAEANFYGNLCGAQYAEVCKFIKSRQYNLGQII